MNDGRAEQLIAKSRATSATYSLYNWNVITKPDQPPKEEWAAEFNEGSRHRVETPRARIVADCAALNGTYLDLESGQTFSNSQIAKVACGISSTKPILSAKWLERISSRFGPLDRIKVTDDNVIRTYDIADNGVLVNATISDLDGTLQLKNWAVDLVPSLPENEIFSEASLARSVVPEKYKQRPAGP
jgi:hypothetical protein